MEERMKRLLAVLLLILCLSFPALAGHTQAGGYKSCECGTPECVEDYPGECDGHAANQQGSSPGDATVGLGIVILALLLGLRLKP
jgi:hypothetical protein